MMSFPKVNTSNRSNPKAIDMHKLTAMTPILVEDEASIGIDSWFDCCGSENEQKPDMD